MDKKTLLKLIDREAVMVWDSLCEIYPNLVFHDVPKFELNGRLWRTAGQCLQAENRIQLGTKFFQTKKNFVTMIDEILPHEIIHQADFNLFGDSEKICGHGEKWREIMVNYGLAPEKYHSMEILRK